MISKSKNGRFVAICCNSHNARSRIYTEQVFVVNFARKHTYTRPCANLSAYPPTIVGAYINHPHIYSRVAFLCNIFLSHRNIGVNLFANYFLGLGPVIYTVMVLEFIAGMKW